MRGFLPAVLCLILGLASTGMWALWQGPGTGPLRFVFGGGFVMLAWHDPANPAAMRRWIGPRTWYLSVGYEDATFTKPRRGWMVMRPLWSSQRFRMENALRIHEQEIEIPLLPAAAVL